MAVTIRQETTEHRAAIWSVNGAVLESEAEINLVDALGEGGFVEVPLVTGSIGRTI